MSPRREVPSLYSSTLCYVSRSLNVFCQPNNPCLEEVLSYITTSLPATLQSDIGEYISKEIEDEALCPTSPTQVKMMLALKSKRVSISGSVLEAGILDNQDASHLTMLSLCYVGRQERIPRALTFLASATSLTHLEAVDCFNDSMMDIVASSCKNLYCLSLRNCPVTNIAMLKLCGLNMELKPCLELLMQGEQLLPQSACSKTLRELRITMTKVSDAGVAIILLILKKLTLLRIPDLRMDKIFEFLDTLKQDNLQCNLKEFHSREQLDQSKLKVLARFCPNLEYIQVSFTGKYEQDFHIVEELMHLKHLNGAKFANINSSALKYFIDHLGIQMKKLHLYTYPPKGPNDKMIITRSQLRSLARSSTNLEFLCIEDYCLADDEDSTIAQRIHFKKLKVLKLKSLLLTEEDLQIFLSESNQMNDLEISLVNPHLLHDHFIDTLMRKGTWSNIARVSILNSPLTSRTLSQLVNGCPELKYLANVNSWLIPQPVAKNYKEWIHKENFDLEVF